MSSIIIIGGVLLKYRNKVLLCKRASNKSYPNTWSIPCGHVNKNEPPKIGALRELYEETNIKLNEINLVGFISKKNLLFYVFFKELNQKLYPELENAKDGHEHSECEYFSLEELPSNVDDQLCKIIKKVLD